MSTFWPKINWMKSAREILIKNNGNFIKYERYLDNSEVWHSKLSKKKKLTKNWSATQLKLSKRLKEKHLNQYLKDSIKRKTVTSYIQRNDKGSQTSPSKILARIPGDRYKETRKSQEINEKRIWTHSSKLKINAIQGGSKVKNNWKIETESNIPISSGKISKFNKQKIIVESKT